MDYGIFGFVSAYRVYRSKASGLGSRSEGYAAGSIRCPYRIYLGSQGSVSKTGYQGA